jgi:hypothetical protein
MKLFTTSKMGLGIKDTGAGKRRQRVQMDFRNQMIELYGSKEPDESSFWCPILGRYCDPRHMKAGHLFAAMHGQDTRDAIFGEMKTPELYSPGNGLMISSFIEDNFDSGKLAIVPDLSDNQTKNDLKSWIKKGPRGYKIRVLDKTGIK